jgi:hypothetical protein
MYSAHGLKNSECLIRVDKNGRKWIDNCLVLKTDTFDMLAAAVISATKCQV